MTSSRTLRTGSHVLLLAVVAGIGCGAAAPAVDAAVQAPACDLIAGRALALDAKWRVVQVPPASGSDWPSMFVACRRGARAGAPVYRLGSQDAFGDFVGVSALVGDRLIIESGTGSNAGHLLQQRLIDLRKGRSAAIGTDASGTQGVQSWSSTLSAMTGNGTVVNQDFRSTTDDNRRTSLVVLPIHTWTAGGAPSTGPPGRFLSAVGSSGSSPGVYFLASDNHVGRLATSASTRGQALMDRVATVGSAKLPTLTPRQAAARHELGFTRGEVAAANEGPAATVVRRRSKGRTSYRLALSLDAGAASANVPLASGDATLIDREMDNALVRARFSDAPKKKRIRLLGADGTVLLDLPDDPAALTAQDVILADQTTVAIAHGDAISLYRAPNDGSAAQVATIAVPGVHDLSANQLYSSMYFTDAAGKAGALWLYDTELCPPGLDATGQCPTIPTPAPSRFVPDASFAALQTTTAH